MSPGQQLASANSRRPFCPEELGKIRCSPVLSEVGSLAAVAERGRRHSHLNTNMNVTTKTVVRVSVMSIAGTAQFMLVVGGCLFYRDLLAAAFPSARHLGAIAGIVGFLSLFWPIYAFMAVPRMGDDMKARIEKQSAEEKP